MPKFNGTISFDVYIEEQTSQEDLDELAKTIRKAIVTVKGVNDCDEVDRDIDEKDDDE